MIQSNQKYCKMKKLFFILPVLLLGFNLIGQDYAGTMQSCLEQLGSAATESDYSELATTFERIGLAEQDKWHPFYYQAFCLIAKGFIAEGAEKKDQIIDAAETAIKKAASVGGPEAELAVLQARANQARLSVDPVTRGMQLGPKTTMLLAEARAKAPDNPRVTYLLGQNIFYTPAAFGGGPDKAIPLVEKSIELFKTYKTDDPFAPKWGQEQAEAFLKSVNKENR